MNKKLIIMTAIIGLAGFAGMFAFAWFTKPVPQANPETELTASSQPQNSLNMVRPEITPTSETVAINSETKKTMTEKQLKSLVYEIREKIEGYNLKLSDVQLREQRLQKAQDTLKQDIDKLNNLRTELSSIVASLKSEQDKLAKSKLAINKIEKGNLMSIAATYDKMAPDSAGKILVNINQAQNSSSDDAIKILHYMTERTKAKVLASIAETDPEVSAYFCQKLKKVTEK